MTKVKKDKTSAKKYSKTAFVDAAESAKESIELQIVLVDGASYSKEEVSRLLSAWKKKEVIL